MRYSTLSMRAAQIDKGLKAHSRAPLHVPYHLAHSAVIVLVAVLVAVAGSTVAHADGDYEITWHTVDGGGATFSTGDGFTLDSTVGQPDASTPHTGDGYTLVGGFWGVTDVFGGSIRPIPGLTTWGLWALAGLLMIAVLGRIWYRGRDGRATAGPSAARRE